ncbi:hypothetical protein [Arcticibacterium luteifluviistationis]|uniref:Secretion protein n=1 Tax=Arcticibacterium luteifluviistationis TaxID=1784714 RepID=A0A2Z4G9R2_9BACT|nr:hypothetical protein [Arcticibacterium luteifluviistationis]AWV97815.1 hypothetical protein DJ013_06390 [Arcticibacterium luteifluviistationis]
MKKLILSAVMLIGLSTATIAEANDHIYTANLVETDLNVKAMKGLKFRVTAVNIAEKSVLELKDGRGTIIYKAPVQDKDYVKVFDLSSLPDGDYSLVLSSGKESSIKAFEIKTETTRVVANL